MRSTRQHRATSMELSFEGDIEHKVSAFFDRIKQEANRTAARAMPVEQFDELRGRVPSRLGKLGGAIYRWLDERDSGPDRKPYIVGVNKAKAPHWWLVEHGHWRRYAVRQTKDGEWITLKAKPLKVPVSVPAQPYLRVSV